MLNSVSLMGRLTADVEVKTTPNDVSVCSFTLAVNDSKDKTNWIDCVAWRKTAEFIGKYFKKGSLIAITGSIQTRSYEDKNGNKRKATEVVVDKAFFAEKKTETPAEPTNDFTLTDDTSEELPF